MMVYIAPHEIIWDKADRVEKFRNDLYLPHREGDLFLMKNMAGKYPRFNGPFRDISMRGPQLSYEISNEFGQTFIRHVRHLKLYNQRHVENPMESYSDSGLTHNKEEPRWNHLQ